MDTLLSLFILTQYNLLVSKHQLKILYLKN